MNRPVRLLLLDDEPDHRLILASALVDADPGIEIAEAGGLQAALATVAELSPDCILADHDLPDGSGLDLLEALRAQGDTTPLILVTNHGSEKLARRAFRRGVDDYVTKDEAFRKPTSLARKIRRAVQQGEILREQGRSDSLFSNFLENNPFAILILGSDGRLIRWNRAFEAMEVHHDSLNRLRTRYNAFRDPQLLKTGIRDRLEQARLGSWVELPPFPWDPERAGLRGPVRILSGVAFPAPLEHGEKPHLCVMIQDVTLQETARRERDEYGAILASLIQASHAAILFVDNDKILRFANQWVKTFFGVDPAAYIGRPRRLFALEAAKVSADPEGFIERQRYLCNHRELTAEDEIELVRPERLFLHRHSGPVRDPNGRILGRIERYTDETGSIERRRQLETQNRELDAFASRIAHDLKTPLVSLRGFADLLQRQTEGGLDDRACLFLDKVRSSAALLTKMVDGLRDLSMAGSETPQLAELDPLPILRFATENLADEAEQRGVRITLPGEAPRVYCDQTRLFQVFQNLLTNAVRYSDPSKPERWVRVEVREDQEQVVFHISDNGLGFDPATRGNLFQPFRRGNASAGISGMGLGLAIVERLVASVGGRVHANSSAGKGSRFTVELDHPPPDE